MEGDHANLDNDLAELEKELADLRPAPVPEPWLRRLAERCPARPARSSGHRRLVAWLTEEMWWRRGLAMGASCLVLGFLAWHQFRLPTPPTSAPVTLTLTPDLVNIDRVLVSSFDAVARLPDGQPVRFRYEEWVDHLLIRDPVRGMVLEQREPRVEVVPISYEMY